MMKHASNHQPADVDSSPVFRVVNMLSRKKWHRAAIGISKSRPFTQMHGEFAHANSLYRAEQYDEACIRFISAYQDNPESEIIRQRITTASLRSGKSELQIDAAQALINADRPAGDALHRIAQELEKSFGYEFIENYYWHSFTEWDNASSHDAIVQGLRNQKVNHWRLLQVMEEGAHLHSDDAKWQIAFSIELAKAERFSQAAAIYHKVSADLAADEHYLFGTYWDRAGDAVNRDIAFANALLQDRKLNASEYGIGVFHESHKQWGLAGQAYADSAAVTSNERIRTKLYFKAGYCYEASLNLSKASFYYDRAIENDPQNVEYWKSRGVTSELEADYNAAYKHYKVALKLSSSDKRELEFRAGYTAWKLNELESAIDHFEAFIDKGDEEPASTSASDNSLSGQVDVTSDYGMLDLVKPVGRLGSAAHVGWADAFYDSGDWVSAIRHYDLGFLSGGLPRAKLYRYMNSLLELGRLDDACRAVIEWRRNPEASPLKLESPRRGGYEARNITYEQFRRNLRVRQDMIMFESNLGLSVDCNPLEMSRFILKEYPGKFVHAWVIDGDVPLPSDLDRKSDVIVVKKGSVQELRLFAVAGYIVNNSTFPTHPILRGEQRYMNTWHGTPLKAMMKDTPESLDYANISRNFAQATSLIYPSPYARDKILGRTGMAESVKAKAEIVGSPRVDGLRSRRLPHDVTTAPNRTVLIAPTWRPEADIDIEVGKLVDLATSLREEGYNTFVRAHHYMEAEIVRRRAPLTIVPRNIPTNDLLPKIDVLVTDYSSIFFDFATTRRPIVFYVPDWADYKQSRGVYLDRDELPGTVCASVSEVVYAVQTSQVHPGIDEFLQLYAPLEDGKATHRAVKLLLGGPTSHDLETETNADDSVLLRGEFLANGISAALISMANALTDRGVRVGVITTAQTVRDDPIRQKQLDRLNDEIPIIARVGAMVNSALEYHARRIVSRAQGAPVTSECLELVDNAYATESRRVLGTSSWTSVVEYEGYSEFWADFVLGTRERGSTTSIFMHNDITAEIKMKFPWMKRIACRYPKFDSAVSVSDDLARINERRLSELLGLETLEVSSARNIVDSDSIRACASQAMPADVNEWLGDDTNRYLLAVGRLSPEKNHSFLIDVMAKVCRVRQNARLIICGEGPLKNTLRSQIHNGGLDDNVFLAGHRDSIYPLMRRADLFVLPSLHEGQPIVLLEAAVLRTPCLSSDIESIAPFEELGVIRQSLQTDLWAERILQHLDGADRLPSVGANMSDYTNESIEQFLNAISVKELGL